ncbi:microtubule-actin cross-linking factor 1 isoform X2 [Hypomesus transpacificus]|uniref:microtubule-actin cross-linking factor 1 isoform X2 n=1 Tax=Hypomesus transpacificus TaxID=137520 RepID=UPI001F082DA2|nr:microtubule-actin cross-linking factor 1 isoform X2 [Hypomesus transpacificus]
MESSDEETLSERSFSERSLRSERSGGSLSPCPSGPQGPPGDTLPWNLARHERRKRKSQDSVLDPAERAVVRVADERDRVQKKTFTKWVNKHLIKVRKHITDLYEDLRDGHNLISLLEVLSGVTLPREKGRMRFHRLQNVQIALDFLKQRQVKLVNIRNDDITDGNPKLTLGLIWTIILHFQISEIYVSGESGDLTAKEKLLIWSQQATEGYPGLRCTNFSSSWSNGRMFNALLHRYRPDLIDMEVVSRQSNRDNLEQAFEIAESLGVTRLLDAEDVDVPSPDEKSVITYVSSIYDAFPKIPEGGEGIAAHEVDQRWSEYQARFSSLLQWSRQHMALMANKNFPQNPVELKALYNEYVHFKETEIPAKEREKSHIEHLYRLLEVWMEFGRIKLPQGLHPNDLEEEWGKLILEMLEREKALRPAVDRLELLLQMANKIQNMALDCEEKLTLGRNTLQADMSRVEAGEGVCCERELGVHLQDCELLLRQLNQDISILRDERFYQVEQLAFRASCLQEELVSLRLQCASVYRRGHFSQLTGLEGAAPQGVEGGISLPTGTQTLLGAVGALGALGASLLRKPTSRSQLVAMSSSEDEGSLRFIYELLGWVEETQDLLERAEWGADLPSVEHNLQTHHSIHTAVEELLHSLKEARNYETNISPNFRSSYSETLAKLEHQYCKLLEHSSWRLRCLESLHAFVAHCTEELIWLNEREEEELAYDWSDNNTNVNAKKELYAEMRSELEEKQEVMQSLQETGDRLCHENHPAKQTVEAYSAALQTQWQWVRQLCVCVDQHLKDNTAYFQFVSDTRECESYLRQLQDTIKRQYTCDKNSRLSKLEDLLQDSMEEKEQLIEYRSSVASLVGRAKTVVQLRPRAAESTLGATTPIRAICDYRQIEANVQITISRGEECVLEDNSQRTKWKVISPTGNEAMVPSVCFTVPPPNQEAIDTASRMEQLYQNVMALWHQLHVNMKSVVSWHYLQKDVRTVSSWSLDTVLSQPPSERDQALDRLDAHLVDFLSDSRESALFTPSERRELEKEADAARQHCQELLVNMETVEKDESVSRSYLSELQNIKLRLEDAEKRLMTGIQTPPPSNLLGDSADNPVQITEQEALLVELDDLRSSLGDVSRRCLSFFQDKPTSSSVPVLRSELNLAVEKIERLHKLSSVFLTKLKMVEVLLSSLHTAESQVKRYESRLSEEDVVPADTQAILALREQLEKWQTELEEQEGVFLSLQSEVQKAREAGSQLNRLHPDRNPELERYQEKANQLTDRWNVIERQMETRRGELETLGSVLQQYREGHSALIHWIEETTERQGNTQAGQADSKVLSEQLAQQTALVAEIEQNQTKLDECQTNSKLYCTSVKDYELQLMTYRAFVESTQKSPVKRRRVHSSSDAITQEFMDLRTRYTALVTLTTQHVKYISDALRRLEEEEKEVEEEKQARVGQVSELLGFVRGLQGRSGGPSAECSLAAQQAISEQLAAKKEEVSEAIRSTQAFLQSKQASKLSPEERARVKTQLEELTATYGQMCESSSSQLLQLERQLAQEEERKSQAAIAGVIDLGTVETFPVFQAAQRGLIDQDTCLVLLESQLTMGGLLQPDSPLTLSLDEGLSQGLIDNHTRQSLSELEGAMHLIEQAQPIKGQLLPVAAAMEEGLIREEVGLRILELQMSSGGLKDSQGERHSLERAGQAHLLPPRIFTKLRSRVNRKELIDPNTAEILNLSELQQRCVLSDNNLLHLLPVKQQPGGTVCLRSGRKVGIFRAVQEGLIDRQVTVRLLEAQLFAGGIADPRSGHRLTVEVALRHGLLDQDLACAMLSRQLQTGGILDPVSGDRLEVEEAMRMDLLSPRLAVLVLEALWAFMGMLWPESGELLPIAEALQQGAISPELARKILRQRHTIGALYLPDIPQVVPLNQAEEVLEHAVVEILREIQIPDVLSNMNQSGSPTLNRLSWSSTGSSPPPSSSSPCPASPQSLTFDPSLMEGMAPEEQASHHLLFHLMTHSYMDAHSGQRLLLLEPELVELVTATGPVRGDATQCRAPDGFNNPPEKQEYMEVVSDDSLAGELDGRTIEKVQGEIPKLMNTQKEYASIQVKEESYRQGGREGVPDGLSQIGKREIEDMKHGGVGNKVDLGGDGKQKEEKEERVGLESLQTRSVGVKHAADSPQNMGEKRGHPQVMTTAMELEEEKSEEDAELERLAVELRQGGLVTEDGDRLLPDEAVAQGLLPGHTAVKLMAQAGLFGGFLDVGACESLSMEDVMQEGLLDEDLMWSVLKSEKSLAGVVDVEKGRICTLKEATQAGLIDPATTARLLEAQVVSGGVMDLHRDKKVSVTLAANLGLIEGEHREELVALEKSCCGKGSDPNAGRTKATLHLQMEGVLDPKTKSPVPLDQAIHSGFIRPEEAYQALSQQVAEGGIVHHASGVRLSVSDAVERGLLDRSIASGLEELEKVYQGEIPTCSHPEATLLQASTGAILDPESGRRLTLTEAVSQSLLDEKTAQAAMTSRGVTEGLLDPQTARIIPYLDLINQGKIDIETGKRFLEVKPFRGIQDKQTGQALTLPQAMASNKVDPVPALRMLQNQADTGGIIDISSGDRLPLTEASKRGLVGEDMVRLIATKQMLKGGILDPSTGRRVSSLKEAVKASLLSKEMAAELQDNLRSVDLEGDNEDSSTPVASSNGSYSPAVTVAVSSPDRLTEGTEVMTPSPPLEAEKGHFMLPITEDRDESLIASISESYQAPQLGDDAIEEGIEHEQVASKGKMVSDQSFDVLTQFASKAEKRLKQALKEVGTQPDGVDRPKPLPREGHKDTKKPMDGEQVLVAEEGKEDPYHAATSEDHVSILTQSSDTAAARARTTKSGHVDGSRPVEKKGPSYVAKETLSDVTGACERETRDHKDIPDVSVSTEGEEMKTRVTQSRRHEAEKERGRMENEKDPKMKARESTDADHSADQGPPPSKEAESKSKKKRKNKKKGKEVEIEKSDNPSEAKHQFEEIGAKSVSDVVKDVLPQKEDPAMVVSAQSASTELCYREGAEVQTKEEHQDLNNVIKDGAANVSFGEGHFTEAEGDALKHREPAGCRDDKSREVVDMVEPKHKEEEMVAQTSQNEGRKEIESTQSATQATCDKDALLLKAKESLLRKVYGGVGDRQATEKLDALRQGGGKKERDEVKMAKGVKKEREGKKEGLVTVVKDSATVESPSEGLSKEKEGRGMLEKKEGEREEKSLPDLVTETKPGKKSKKNTKFKKSDTDEIETAHSKGIPTTVCSIPIGERGVDGHRGSQSDSGATTTASVDETNKMATSAESLEGGDKHQQRPVFSSAPEITRSHLEDNVKVDSSRLNKPGPLGQETEYHSVSSPEEEVQSDSQGGADSVKTPPGALTTKLDPVESRTPAAETTKTVGKAKKKKKKQQQQQQQQADSPSQTETKTREDQLSETQGVSQLQTQTRSIQGSPQTSQSLSDEPPTGSDTTDVPGSDTTESWGEEEEEQIRQIETKKERSFLKTGKSSLVRQECLEHDQRIVALLSMVRHIEVRLKQQQQQSIGRSLIALDDIIKQTEVLSLELKDLEPEVTKEVEAARGLVEPRPQEVPPQLLTALEKDGRGLARSYEAARGVSDSILQGLQAHRDSYKEAVSGEQKSLGGRVEELLSWLRETETQMEGSDRTDGEHPPAQLIQQLQMCKELQSSLSSRSNEVNTVAFDIQVFISERAQDLVPEQSRHLLGQLQQLQRAFHQASGQAQAQANTLSAQREREEERRLREKEKEDKEMEREREMQNAREREVVQQQKADCSQKLEGLTMWLAGAASMLANQRAGTESGDVSVLQQKQRELKEVQKDLQTRGDGVTETIRSVEDFLSEHGDNLTPEEKTNLQEALARMKEQYGTLKDSTHSSLAKLDTTISTTVQQNTQRAKAVEDLQKTQGKIDSLLGQLSTLSQPGSASSGAGRSVIDAPSSSSPPDSTLETHTDMLQAELQQLQAQQAQLLQVTQQTRSLLEQPDSAVPPEEKQRLRAQLDLLSQQHQDKLKSCQDRLRRSETLKDELAKFIQEHGVLGSWLEQSERELSSLGEGDTDAPGLKGRLEEHKKLSEDVICHKADLRFVSISGQKVLDSVQAALEKVRGSDPALEGTKHQVSERLQDANHRYTALHSKSSDLGGRLSGLLERYQQYQDEAVSLHTWLGTQEQNQSISGPNGETDTHTLQSTLRNVQLLQDELAERSVQLEKVRRAGMELGSTQESPSLRAADILSTTEGLENRFSSLSESVSKRAEHLQTAVAQSVSVQEGLKGLLAWLDSLVLAPGPAQPTAQAVQDALTQNQKLRQELLSRQGSVEATRDAVSTLLQSADASTASGLQGALRELTQRYAAAQARQAESEAQLKTLLPKLEGYERLSGDLQNFIQTRQRALSPLGQPERSVEDYRQTIEEVKSELEQEAGQLMSFCELGTDLSQSKALTNTQSLLDNVKQISEAFARLEANINERFSSIQTCEQQLSQFRGLSGSLLRWLQTAQEQLPPKEPNLDTQGLQRRVKQLQDLLSEWEAQGGRVQELNKTGSQLETLIISITGPQIKTGVPQTNGSGAGNPSSVNGIHTCKDMTELQVAVAEVNGRYEDLGGELRERRGRQEASLEQRQKARQGAEQLSHWLGEREHSLALGQTASPSKPEVVRAQAQENKALLTELTEHAVKVEELKGTLRKLISENPDSPEADKWRQQLQDIDARWEKANQTAAQRQTELETCADRLGSFATAASQLGPWLREKELMMSVLGPLSIDPNMLNTQKQQVQFMLREFETRAPQFQQLTQAAEGILSPSGDGQQDPKDLEEVHSELGSISQQWEGLMSRLAQRSQHIDQAQGTSESYQTLLRDLSSSLTQLGERLDAQASLSAQPEALKQRLQETGEIRSELERRRAELGEAQRLCGELSAIVAEPYLREELSKRLESVSGPLRSLEERAADGLSQLQAALSSTQQFQQMFEEVRSWLDNQCDQRDSSSDSLPCQPGALSALLAQTEELQRGVASQRGPYELIQAEGASLLASLPAGGEERSALQSRLFTLRQDWEGLNQRITDHHNRLKSTLGKAETYQQHRAELGPWVAECQTREAEIRPSLNPAALDEALQRTKQLGLDLERRRPLLEALNTAADQLLEQCRVGEEEVRDEKAQLNRSVDRLVEGLQARSTQLEELASRLKEFEDGRQAVERRLEAARHQIEVQEALGPQACSNKSLERLRNQQEALRSLQPQVVYLRDLSRGLVQDAPQTPGGSAEGGQKLEQQANQTEREYGDVTEKIEQCCSTLESRLQGVGEVQSHVRDVFSRLADLDDELDSLSPVGRDPDSLASQAEALRGFLSRLAELRSELEGHGGDCTAMLRREGSSPDLLALRRETEALSRQAGKLSERGGARLTQIEDAAQKVREFYGLVAELQGLLGRAEEGLEAQGVVGTEVDTIKQQLQEFKAVEREQVECIQPRLQHVNAVGQGLIQSAAKHTDTQALEHDLDATNLHWNSLNKRVAERIAQLQEALLHCGKFQDALEPLLSWLSDTEELVANQKPPSAEYRVVKAQIQEQKLLQRLLDDRRGTVEMIQAEGERIAATADTSDQDKIQNHLHSLRERWGMLLEKASGRQRQLEELQVLALQFHEALEPLGEWLSATERRLSSAEPMGTQTSKITQQIARHKSLNEEIVSRKKTVDQAIKNGQALLKQTTGEEVLLIQEKLDGIKSRYAEMTAGSSKALRTLEQALQLATRFAAAHEDISQWLDSVETELNDMEPDAAPAYQDRQKELKNVSAEKRLVLDTVNEMGSALLDLVPWRAREGLDKLVADANQRYRQADETITQRVQLVQAAIQRSQQYEEGVDAELAWVGETERKLASLGPLSLEPDVTVAQLQVQRAFNIDIIRHKDTVDQLLNTREDILDTCSDAQRDALKVKTDSLSSRYEAVSQNHSERFSALEQAQVLVARFWETQEELEPWLGETESLISQLPPPAIDTDALRLQQEQMRLLRESIAEHKPHIDKLLKIGPQLAELSAQEGATVRQRYSQAEKRYLAIKEEVKGRATSLDEAVSQSAQFHDKMDPLLETLEGAVQRLRQPPPVAAEVDKIREQLAEHRASGLELDKLLPSFSALCARGEELISRAAHDDPAAQAVRSRLLRLRSLWDEIRQRAEEREGKLTDVLDLSGKFWADMAALLSTLRDSQDIVKELEDPGVDPSLIKQQIEAAEAIKAETDGLREELEFVRTLGADLIFACGETEKPEVKKTIDEMNAAWEGLDRTWRERMERLEEAMTASVQYQDALQGMFDYLDNAVIKLCDMPTVGTDLGTVKQQIEELKHYKVEVYQQQIDMEKLSHQGELLLKKVSDQTDRDMIQEPLTELRHLWDNLGDKITQRQHKLEGALLALGQFQHALAELVSWLSHTHATLDTQRPINSDPKAIEIELAKHHVLRNDVLSHRSTVETVNGAGTELLESSPGDEASHLRDQLEELSRSWEGLLLKTQDRQKLLEAALHQAEGFHGELEDFLLWLRRTDSQLSAAKPTGGLPETAREQLQQHMEVQSQLNQRGEQYHHLLDQGESMLLARGGDEANPGTSQTQQNLALLQNKWASLNTKMDDRRAKLDEAVSLATGFQSSLQDTINWLTGAEQTLNMAQPPSLILDTVVFQIDEHKVFVNEVNTHREQVLALEKAGSQLRFASLKQDVVLIKNLLLSVQARWDKLVQRSLDRGRHLDEARKRAKQFHEAWRKLTDWLEEAESRLDSELEISNEPDKIKVQLAKHKEFQKALGSKQPVYDTTVRSGKAMRDKATLPDDTQKMDHLLGEVRDKWDTVCGKSVERQHKLEEALLFSGQFAEALQALVDWLYRVEPQLSEDQPVHGDLDLVSNLMDSHKAFQKDLGKRTSSVQALKRSARDLMDTGRDDTAWVKVQVQELSNRWETVCALSVTKQTRLEQALKKAEDFRVAVQMLLEWLSEAEQTLRFRGVLPEEAETLQKLLHTHRDFMATVEEKRADVNRAAGMGEGILTMCHPDCITTIKHWITIIRARFEEVLTWAKQHEQRLETALTELLNNATLLEELLSWLQWAETTLVQRDTEPLPQDITQLKTHITEHQVFMEEMTRKQPDVDKVTKTYKRKPAEPPSSLAERRGARKNQQHQQQQQQQQAAMQVAGGNPRLNQLCSRWQQVWLLALDRQRKLNDALDRLEELKEFANFDFDVWRKKYMRWMNHKKSRVMDFFRRIDKDQDGKITRQEFIDGILASKFPTSKLEMMAVADIFDRDGDGYIDYYEFVAALHPNKDAYRPTTDADKIEDEVTRQVAQCKCAKRFQVEQIGENKYRFFLGNQFGDSQQLRLVRILRSTVMVRVGGGWMALDEFLVKNDPCRVQHPGLKILRSDSSSSISSRILARGRTNLELREKFILPEGASQGLAAFRSRGRRSKPGSRTASPTRSSSSASHSAHSCASLPSAPATPTASASSRSSHTHSRDYAKPWLAHSKTPTPTKCQSCPDHGHITPGHEGAVSGSKLKRPTFHSSRGSLTGENGGANPASAKPGRSDPKRGPSSASGHASRAGSRASSRRGSDASDASELMETRSACSDTSDTPRRPGGAAKPSKIPTISKKAPSPKTPGSTSSTRK